jgi:hypothetical protein
LVPNLCKGDSLGIIGIAVMGGTGQLKFSWSNGKSTPAIGKLPNGIYSLEVTDANNCRYNAGEVEMFSESNLDIEVFVESASFGNNDGSISINLIDGIAPFSIEWGSDTLQGFTLNQLSPGEYQAVIKDSIGCLLDTMIIVNHLSSSKDLAMERTQAYPNPTNGVVYFKNIRPNAPYSLFNSLGYEIRQAHLEQYLLDLHGLPPGIYFVTIPHGKSTIKYKIIKQ